MELNDAIRYAEADQKYHSTVGPPAGSRYFALWRLADEVKRLREKMIAHYRAECALGKVLDDDMASQAEWLAAREAKDIASSLLFAECEKAAAEAPQEGGGM